MNAVPLCALLLAAAVLAAPVPARLRIPRPPVRNRPPRRVITVAAAVGAAALIAAVPVSTAVVVAMVAAGAGGWRRRRRSDRHRDIEGQILAAALETLIGELQIGAHAVRAVTIAAAESPGRVGDSLRAVAARARLGADVVAGLRSVAVGSAVPAYWIRLAVFWELAVHHGLPMAALMRAAHRDIVERQRFVARTRSALAGARATAVILALLPLLGVVFGQLLGADPFGFLLGGGVGGLLLIAGVGLNGIGLLWAGRIIERAIR